MGQYAESDIVLESNSLLRAVFFIPKNKERQVTIMRQAVTTVQYVFAGIGGFMGWFLGGLDGFLYALLMFVVIDYATGLMAAFVQKKYIRDSSMIQTMNTQFLTEQASR